MLWRRWKFTAGFAVVAAVLALVSVWLTGMAQAKFYINSILLMASLASHTGVAEHPIHWQWMPNVTGFLVGLFGGLGIPRFWIIGASVVVSISILVFVVRRGFTTPDDGDRFLLGVPCAVFVGYHTYLYDLSPLLLPMLVMLNRYLFFENDRSRREKWFARSAVLMFVAPIIDSYAPDYTYFAALAVVALMFAVTYAVEGRPSKPVEIGAHAVAYQENV